LASVTGREVATVNVVRANRGAPFSAVGGDVDSGAAIVTLEDETFVRASASLYNGGDLDMHLHVMESKGTMGVGYDDWLAVRSAEADLAYLRGPQKRLRTERFQPACRVQLTTACAVVAERTESHWPGTEALLGFRVAQASEVSRVSGGSVQIDCVGDAT
jgi:myo-inositol 2-dehydrogenase/D-chiro-inositol 1-dehydrogenase